MTSERGVKKKRKRLYGVGINDADYVTSKSISYFCEETGKLKQKTIWVCPFYRRWANLVGRCYSNTIKKRQPAYNDCYLSQDWITFSKFKAWMEKQDWEGKDLDKDLLFPGNKVYSAETCVFIDIKTNRFLVEQQNKRGEWPIGVNYHKGVGKFVARCWNPFTGLRTELGYFDDPQEAHKSWLTEKLKQAKLLALKEADPRVSKALIERYENYGN